MVKSNYQPGYLGTQWWRRRRQRSRNLADNRCEFVSDNLCSEHEKNQRCCVTNYHLDTHHHKNAPMGKEKDADIKIYCKWHHIAVEVSEWKCRECKQRVIKRPEELYDLIKNIAVENLSMERAVDEVKKSKFRKVMPGDKPGRRCLLCEECTYLLKTYFPEEL